MMFVYVTRPRAAKRVRLAGNLQANYETARARLRLIRPVSGRVLVFDRTIEHTVLFIF
jgi:UDP-N-acetylmuramyl tripeptide synthase